MICSFHRNSLRYNDFLRRAIESRLVPSLGQLFQSFDATMHIPTRLQSSLLASKQNDFGQEIELFLTEMSVQFAPQQYWDRQTISTPTGAQMRHHIRPNNHEQLLHTQLADNSHQADPSTLQNSPTYDTHRTHGQQDPVTDPQHASQGTTTQNLTPPMSEALQSDPLPNTDTRTRFSRCPTCHICPHTNCTFPHRNNPGRLTRHWRIAHPNTINRI